MATLEKIRNKAGLLVIVVGVALFAFIIGDFLNSGTAFFRQSQERVAKVNGENIGIMEYQQQVDEMTEVYKLQTGMSNIPEEYVVQIRQTIYNNMVEDVVMKEDWEKLGIIVTPEELFDMVQGENISPMVQQMPMFRNPETGAFDKNALLNFLKMIDDQNIASYPAAQQAEFIQARNYWLFWEKSIKRDRLNQKYTTLITKALTANSLETKDMFNATAVSADMNYVVKNYSTIPDSTISVSKSELEALYKQKKDMYPQEETKVISYIAVDVVPSQEDFDDASKDIDLVKEDLRKDDTHIAEIVNEVSEAPYVDAFRAPSAYTPEVRDFAEKAEIGEIEGPIFEGNVYKLYKLVDKTTAPDSVLVNHIMLASTDQARADSLLAELNKGAKFSDFVSEFSIDPSAHDHDDHNAADAHSGEMGWFTETLAMGMGDEFKNTIFSLQLNKYAIVKSMYGIHIITITDKTADIAKYKVADVEMRVEASSKTQSNIYNQLNQFIVQNNSLDKMETKAAESGYHFVKDVRVGAADQAVAMMKDSRPVIRWAFNEAKKGQISDIFDADNKFIVACYQGTLPKGNQSLNALTPALRSEIIAKKKGEQIVADLKAKNLTSLDAYASETGSNVQSVNFVTFSTNSIGGIGMEPTLNAYVSLAEQGQLSQPIAGNNGVYVFQVTNRTTTGEYNEAEQMKAAENNQTYAYKSYMAIQEKMRKADVEDNRIRFY